MKAFIITLSKIPTSVETAVAMIEPLRSFGFDVELFEGTYGHEAEKIFDQETRLLADKDHKGQPPPKTIKSTGPGAKGCFYSHYRLWQKCVELDQPIFIFEDDVVFTYDRYHPVEFDELLIVAVGNWSWIVTKLPDYSHKLPNAVKFNGLCLPGTVGYAIKPKAAKKLLKEYEKTYLPADVAIKSSLINIEIHTHVIGRALTKEEGKISLVKTKLWNSYE